jgi:hypothetical protein
MMIHVPEQLALLSFNSQQDLLQLLSSSLIHGCSEQLALLSFNSQQDLLQLLSPSLIHGCSATFNSKQDPLYADASVIGAGLVMMIMHVVANMQM